MFTVQPTQLQLILHERNNYQQTASSNQVALVLLGTLIPAVNERRGETQLISHCLSLETNIQHHQSGNFGDAGHTFPAVNG